MGTLNCRKRNSFELFGFLPKLLMMTVRNRLPGCTVRRARETCWRVKGVQVGGGKRDP